MAIFCTPPTCEFEFSGATQYENQRAEQTISHWKRKRFSASPAWPHQEIASSRRRRIDVQLLIVAPATRRRPATPEHLDFA
jgi:hypothetical protein